ncbi:MAG TPA: glycosyltransferase [Anaerolineales bacterium]|nr:glycosyltransferase [Anaerolineales bacterium]
MPETFPLVSIIIPNYNHAQYIEDAIHSVLRQTYRNVEIIVVDDGSRDNSREVIGAFGDTVRAIFQQNQGLSAARNTGITASRGEFIGVLDADDMYEPDFVETLVTALQSQSDADGIYCGYRFVDHVNQPLPQIEAREIAPEKLYWALVDGNFLVPESMFVRKRCYDAVGLFDTSLRALEDLDMWLRITSRFKVIHTTKILTRHRILPGSMSTDPTRQFENRLQVVKKNFGAEPAPTGEWSRDQRRAFSRAYLVSAVEYLQAKNEVRAFECLRSMAVAQPALLARVETFYELACGDQPKGYRGEFASINLEQNTRVTLRLLEKLFADHELRLTEFKRPAYANAEYAFGLLAYGQGDVRAARRHFLGALRVQPALMMDRAFVGSLLRSFLGAKLIQSLRRMVGRSK